MYTRLLFKIIPFSLVVFFNACTPDELIYNNPQDPNSLIYLNEINLQSLSSFSDVIIKINIKPENEKRISIERNIITNSISIQDAHFFFNLPDYEEDETISILDTNNIQLDMEYEYIIRNVSIEYEADSLYSVMVIDTIEHKLSIPRFTSITQISATSVELKWDFEPTIEKTEALAEFVISRTSIDSDIIDDTFRISYNPEGPFTFIDDSLHPRFNYTYIVGIETVSGNQSNTDSSSIFLNFPDLQDKDWLPISLERIHLNWSFSPLSEADYTLDSLKIYRFGENGNTIRINESLYPVDLQYEFTDTLENPEPAENWSYIIEWCGGFYCESDTSAILTTPFRYMVLVPGTDNYTYGRDENWEEADVRIDSFYISIYETPDSYYNDINQDLTDRITELDNPEASANINWEAAVDYCSKRTESILKSEFLGEGLRLPTKYEWEYAASFDEGSHERKYSFGDYMNSSLANYYLSEYGNVDAPLTVGYFNGINSGTQDAQSYLGLYDMNGNVMEWTSTQEQTSVYICKGGGFLNEGTDCNNTNEFTYSEVTTHKTIGFRPVISAKELLDYLKGKLE